MIRNQSNSGSSDRAVSNELESIEGNIGKEADGNGLLNVEVVPKSAGNENPVDFRKVHSNTANQNSGSSEDRPFGFYQIADIIFRNNNVPAGLRLVT